MFPGVSQEVFLEFLRKFVVSGSLWLPDALDASIFTKSVNQSSKQHPEVLCLTWRLDVFLPIDSPKDSRLGTTTGVRVWSVRRCMIPCNFQPLRDQVVPGTGNSPLAASHFHYKIRGFRSQEDGFLIIIKGNWWGNWWGVFWWGIRPLNQFSFSKFAFHQSTIQKKTLIPSICIPAAVACLPSGVGPQQTTQMSLCALFWHPSHLHWQCEWCHLFDCVFMGRFQKTRLIFFWHFQQSSIHPTFWVGYFVLLWMTFSPLVFSVGILSQLSLAKSLPQPTLVEHAVH